MKGFIAFAQEPVPVHRARSPMADGLSDGDLGRTRDRLGSVTRIASFWLAHEPGETLANAIRCTGAIGASIIRLHLTPGARGGGRRWARAGTKWSRMRARR